MPFCKSKDDVDIYYELIGKGDMTLVFVTGWSGKSCVSAWSNQLYLS